MKKSIYLLVIFALILANCSKKSDPAKLFVDPSTDPERLANEITFTSSTTKVNGLPPTPSASGAPVISNASSASAVASSTVYIPVTYSSSNAPTELYIQVVGATTFYFKIPLTGAPTSGTLTLPMTISANVLVGSFTMSAFVVSGSLVSVPELIFAAVTEPLACDNGSVSGTDGVTNTRHQLNGKAGTVSIAYDTYSLPDRIDVFLDGNQWKGGTGSIISPPPPTSDCTAPLAGFVGATGTITFAVTTSNKYVDVYVSGCLGSGTAWDYTFTCPN